MFAASKQDRSPEQLRKRTDRLAYGRLGEVLSL